jgi:predicted ester cyclase
MTLEQKNEQIVRGWIERVFNARAPEVADDYKNPVTYKSHSPFPGTTPNLNGFMNAFGQVLQAFPDFKFHAEEIISKGDIVVVRATWTGTHRGTYMGIAPTNKKLSVTRLDMLRIEGDMIVEHWGFGDDWNKIRQLTTKAI